MFSISFINFNKFYLYICYKIYYGKRSETPEKLAADEHPAGCGRDSKRAPGKENEGVQLQVRRRTGHFPPPEKGVWKRKVVYLQDGEQPSHPSVPSL